MRRNKVLKLLLEHITWHPSLGGCILWCWYTWPGLLRDRLIGFGTAPQQARVPLEKMWSPGAIHPIKYTHETNYTFLDILFLSHFWKLLEARVCRIGIAHSYLWKKKKKKCSFIIMMKYLASSSLLLKCMTVTDYVAVMCLWRTDDAPCGNSRSNSEFSLLRCLIATVWYHPTTRSKSCSLGFVWWRNSNVASQFTLCIMSRCIWFATAVRENSEHNAFLYF